ncbi:UDP-N-acetylglucosamine--N-acetylmuramyl-(pentapeptide) pyrophosphoryl-undecaprenol N-acetylglucosamine transferase [Spirochaetia bacterium]|nr:UDP-N-acetylglucosamine--N-acetylmuramyl-(pentapeptide) pyrophosphoryl-undecaprenol N-acetylglucosamine transferase [Spirochaetia bacterium]
MTQIAFTGGGTGGHIYPGLAVISRLREMGYFRICWIGSNKGMDRSLVEAAGLEFYGIPSGKLRRYFSLKNIPDIFRVLGGFFAARRLLEKISPALLFSKGGFVSVPPCVAAASLGIPVFTHESDYSPGLATRINIRFAKKIFTACEDTADFLPPKCRTLVTVSGNPVRPEFRHGDAARGELIAARRESSTAQRESSAAAGRAFLGVKEGDRVLLVLGGSLGAQELNSLVRESLAELTKLYVVVHQTGPKNDWDIPAGERYRPYPYIRDEMPQVLAAAEVVLGRSGAGTVWESAACGLPMVLVPLSGSGTRGDQVENARFFEKAGAAVVLLGSDANPENLVKTLKAIAGDDEKRTAMAAASAALGKIDGASLIAKAICEYIGKQP